MRKKFTMLFAALLAFVGVAKAGVTDLPTLTEDTSNPTWYTIKNVRTNKFATYAGDAATMSQNASASGASFFYFTASTTEGAVKIHNYAAGENLCAAYNSWTATGIDWYLKAQATGVSICTSTGEWNAWNDAGGNGQKVEYWSASDPGSAWEISLVTDFSAVIDVNAAKTAAIAEINNYAVETSIYPAATDAVAAVNAVTPASNGLKDLDDAVEAINAIVVDYRDKAYQALAGKYFTIQTLTTERTKGFMQMATSNVVGSELASSPANIWQFVYNGNATVNVYNPYTGKYLCEPQGNSSEVAVTTDKANAGAYVLNVNASASVAEAKVKLTSNGKSVHMSGSYTLVRWDNGGASEWQVVEVKDFSNIISSYKTASTATLDSWATLSVVFDAELIATAKTAINAINTTDYATFAAIDAELKNVTDKVAEKYFTFKNTDTATNARVDAYLAANASTNKGYGTKTFDYSAIWRLLSAGGTSFYLYNELNNVYLKNPSSGALVADAAQAATYTFEIVDAATNKAELKSGSETLHLSNACALMSYDENDPASRWIIATYDYKADLTALIAENENNHEEIPSLGKYPTAAYNALVEAGNTATTVQAVAEAIDAFKAAKNLPVFTIGNGNVKAYAEGMSIYDDNDGTLNFKATNVYDKTMWWALDMTETVVKVTEEVGIYNVGTGNGFWGAASIKVTETSENDNAGIADDNIFLFYKKGGQHPIHFQEANKVIVEYWSYEATSGSAAMFTYIGNTYDLNKLTDAHIAALPNLQAAYDAKAYAADAEVGEGLGQYQGDKDAIVTALNAGKAILDMSLAEQAALDVDAINAATEALKNASDLTLNMPVQGKFYRVKSVNSGNYVTAPANTGVQMTLNAEASANNILYWDAEGHLLVYGTGYYINGKNHAVYGYKDTYTVEGSKTGVAGAYAIKPSAANYWHDNGANLDVYQNGTHANCNWTIEEVTTLPVAITTAGYATFYAPVEVTLPAEVTAHTVTANGEWATLSEAISVVPAENGVILAGVKGTYELAITTTGAEDLDNALAGTVAKTLVSKTEGDAYYVLAMQDENVGLYNPVNSEDATKFYNAGFKAYWHIAAAAQGAGYRFGEGTTAIDSVELTNDNVVIYDLAGRRVEKMEKGIYIVNGKKVIR